jgi:site-specific recombinase XerD
MSLTLTVKPVINYRNKTSKSGLYFIYVRITIERKSRFVKLGKAPKISKNDWNKNNRGAYGNYVKNTHPLSFEINQEIQELLDKIMKIVKRNYGNSLSFTELFKELKRKGDGNIFNDYAREYIKNPHQKLDDSTLEKYKIFLMHLDNFNPKIRFSELNSKMVSGFQRYLQITKNLGGATVKSYFDKFKVVVGQAEREMYLTIEQTRFLFADVKIKVEKANRVFLEINEIQMLINLIFPISELEMERDRDMFLFQIYTGYYYNDLQVFKKEHVVNHPDFGDIIVGERDKNGETAIIPLFKFPKAQQIIEKYRTSNNETKFMFDDNLFIEPQKYNFKLKKIAKRAGITKDISNKVARHTNAQLWVRFGAKRPVLSKMLGHTNEATSNNYYEVDVLDVIEGTKNIDFTVLGI